MTDFKRLAKGQPCLIRLPGCDGGGITTVLCHYRLAGYSGTGMKPDDLSFGAYGCHSCHQKIDNRVKHSHSQEVLRLAHAEGVMRTVDKLRKDGVI